MLFNKQNNNEQLMKQYEICTDMADKISQRRGETNKFYSAIMLAFVSAILAMFKDNINTHALMLSLLVLLGVSLNIVWILNIFSYKKLNSAKYAVINKLEENMEHKPYTDEWKNTTKNKYIRLTYVEMAVPIIFIVFFFLLEILTLYYYCHKLPFIQ